VSKETEVFFVRSVRDPVDTSEFFSRVSADRSILNDFLLYRGDARAVSDLLREWMVKHGTSSLFYHHTTCDAVMHPGITVDEIEELILSFVASMKGVKNLWITDPFIFSRKNAVVSLFAKMINELAGSLQSVTFFTKSDTLNDQRKMLDVLIQISPSVRTKIVVTEIFHDRYWIDPDKNKGIVIGTSQWCHQENCSYRPSSAT